MPTNKVVPAVEEYEDDGLDEPDEIFGAESAPKKPAARKAPAEIPAIEHPATLVRRAKLLGFPEDKIASTPTDELDLLVFDAYRKETLKENQLMRNEFPAPVAPAAPTVPDEDSEEALLDYAEKEGGFDAKLVKLLKKQNAKIKELEGHGKKVEERETQRQVLSSEDAYDAAFDGLGETFHAVFGEGDGRDMQRDSKEMKRRIAVLKTANVNPNTDSPIAIQRKVAKAAKEMFGDLVSAPKSKDDDDPYAAVEQPKPKAKPKNGRVSQEDWDAAALARPTNRAGQGKTKSQQAAVDAVRSYYREHSVSTDESDDAQLGGVPK